LVLQSLWIDRLFQFASNQSTGICEPQGVLAYHPEHQSEVSEIGSV
jgi:hypothetical protein